MSLRSINPYDGELLGEHSPWTSDELNAVLDQVTSAQRAWSARPLHERGDYLRRVAEVLRQDRDALAAVITQEMGKLTKEAKGEIDKCAWVCDYYADQAAEFLADEAVETDGSRSFVAYQPLGTVFAIMPWNFPFWQVFRFAAPALMAGNAGVLKHANNVSMSATLIEDVFRRAGLPDTVFRALMIEIPQVEAVIRDRRISAVTLTGSERAGEAVGAQAGAALKKCVLELGGSDPFVVLDDADLERASRMAVASRFINGGQSCIAAKRFIIVEAIAEAFLERFAHGVQALRYGDPADPQTSLPPLARADLRDGLHAQVQDSLTAGAVAVTGCAPIAGTFAGYQPSILDQVKPGMRAYGEELFGPVAVVIRAPDTEAALAIASDSDYGLGASVWTQDPARGEAAARRIQSGSVFVNGMVKSDPRLPFGGIKRSGYGRELSYHGMREFVNVKTVWMG